VTQARGVPVVTGSVRRLIPDVRPTVRAIRITEFGGPEVLTLVDDQPEPEAGPGTQVLTVSHAGVNYADTHQAEDSYLAPSTLPLVPGAEAVGTLEDGRRVVACSPAAGTPSEPSPRTDLLRPAGRGRGRPGARAGPAGHHRLAPPAHLRAAA
jgi:NADPH:quinone reductase